MYVERAIKHRGFPMPETRFGGRMRFWLLSDVIAWERRMAAQERKR
jgi:predicted DNA-binding transcriptional regulator AlpA